MRTHRGENEDATTGFRVRTMEQARGIGANISAEYRRLCDVEMNRLRMLYPRAERILRARVCDSTMIVWTIRPVVRHVVRTVVIRDVHVGRRAVIRLATGERRGRTVENDAAIGPRVSAVVGRLPCATGRPVSARYNRHSSSGAVGRL